jgi:hypothetical protein
MMGLTGGRPFISVTLVTPGSAFKRSWVRCQKPLRAAVSA